jgi:NAD(P)-dependent dehydrogenase (short-subunit alcohol dehydrogenase family)
MTQPLTRKTVRRILITGASRGIGLEFTRQYLGQGHHVFACCRTPAGASDLQALALSPGRLEIVPMDVADEASVGVALDIVNRQVGGLDILINNAGVFPTAEKNLDTFDVETMMRTLRVNTVAPLAIIRQFRGLLQQGCEPRIVNIASAAGSFGTLQTKPSTGHYSYKSSKTALNVVTCLVAHELRDEGIAVFSMRPGWVRTDMTSQKGDLTAEDSVRGMIKVIAQATLSDSGTFLTWEGGKYPW